MAPEGLIHAANNILQIPATPPFFL